MSHKCHCCETNEATHLHYQDKKTPYCDECDSSEDYVHVLKLTNKELDLIKYCLSQTKHEIRNAIDTYEQDAVGDADALSKMNEFAKDLVIISQLIVSFNKSKVCHITETINE